MLTRGEFAMIGRVGRKALRLYEQEGILLPATRNKDNGYHYYDEDQLGILEKIKIYRKYGISLSEIKSIINGLVPEEEVLTEKSKHLERQMKEMQKLREEMSSHEKGNPAPQQKEIEKRIFSENMCLYVEENIELENLGTSVGKLYEKAALDGRCVSGPHFVKYEGMLTETVCFSMRTCLPIRSDEQIENQADLVCLEKGAKCLFLRFEGGFSRVGAGHLQMKEYIYSNQVVCTGTVYEVYNNDMSVDLFYEIL